MATTIPIVCPECAKQIKVPENILGKKIRCKFCQAAFVASKSGGNATAKPGEPAKPTGKAPPVKPAPAKPAKPAADEDDDDPNPYGMIDVDLSSRCPDCANEMEEDAIVCLVCGYNTQTRERHKTLKTYDNTVGDQILWLLPGIACVLVIIAVLIFNIWYLLKIDQVISWDNDPFYLGVWTINGIKLWVVIMSLGILFFTGRFAIKRLILQYSRPEVVKAK